MKRLIKSRLFCFILGFVLAVGTTVYAANTFFSYDIGFKPENDNWDVQNVEEALNDLYSNQSISLVYDFPYIGQPQKLTVPKSGKYKLEVWGAQGGDANSTYVGGKGGYSTGTVTLSRDDILYVVVGGKGNSCSSTCTGGYNGGGNGFTDDGAIGSGGGLTHIGTFNSTLSSHGNNTGLYIVAGAGGGAMSISTYSAYGNGGYGGGLTGGVNSVSSNRTYKYDGTGGSQETGGRHSEHYSNSTAGVGSVSDGRFGQGGSHASTSGGVYISGGGGGYYGGGAGYITTATGGSGYIGGVTNGNTIDGSQSMPSPNGGTEIGHSGHGYARITYLGN